MLRTAGSETRLLKPVTYQDVGGTRHAIASGYRVVAPREVEFEIGPYDASRPLAIDPQLLYSTYLGGTAVDRGNDIALDAAGNAYVVGETSSANFPLVGSIDAVQALSEAFVTKFSPDGSVLFSTYLGGSQNDYGIGIAVDPGGTAIFVGGDTLSADFPTLNGFNPTLGGVRDGFFARISTAGPSPSLSYSTHIGAKSPTAQFKVQGVAMDSLGRAYVVGYTNTADSPDFLVTAGTWDTTFNGNTDAVVLKINPSGSGWTSLLWSTYLGGSYYDYGNGIAVDSLLNVYVAGQVWAPTDFPVTAGAYDTLHNGGADAFVTKLTPNGPSLVYNTFLGGGQTDATYGIAVDASFNAYVTGQTNSVAAPAYPTTAGSFQPSSAGVGSNYDGFVTKLNSSGSGLVYSTFLSSPGGDSGKDIALDSSNRAYVLGQTNSSAFPTLDAFQSHGGAQDEFVLRLNAAGSGLEYSTYLGGSGDDWPLFRGIAADPSGTYAWVTGFTSSVDFPTMLPYDGSYGGGADAFVAKIGLLDSDGDGIVRLAAVHQPRLPQPGAVRELRSAQHAAEPVNPRGGRAIAGGFEISESE
ncbi:MAG: SBBP repeat-containing protein [Acidobacteria bacterium]|nr:SBBP repeat-containing protein [Acidobacteriota bacterium]